MNPVSIFVSLIVYVAATYYLGRYLDGMEIPKGMTRSLVIFSLAIGLSYGASAVVDWIAA
jgi:hypothetical protein